MEVFTAGDGVYSYGKVFVLGLVGHWVISSGSIYVRYVNGLHSYTSTLHAKIKSDNNLISFLIYWLPRKIFFFCHQHSSIPKVCPELDPLNRTDLVITPLREVRIIEGTYNCEQSHPSIHSVTFRTHFPKCFTWQFLFIIYWYNVQKPRSTKNSCPASSGYQNGESLHLATSAKLKLDRIGRNANLENNPISRIQHFEIPVTWLVN
jgi:hypothetical protein